METNQTFQSNGNLKLWHPPAPQKYDKTPTNRRELETCFLNVLRLIYLKTNNIDKYNNQFALLKICHDYGIKDNRVVTFLQEVGILEKTGKNKGTKWFWIADIKPTPLIAGDVVRKWTKWKSNQGKRKNVFISKFPEIQSVKSSERQPINKQKSMFDEKKQDIQATPLQDSFHTETKENPEQSLKKVLDMVKESAKKREENQNKWEHLMGKLSEILDLSKHNACGNNITHELLTEGHLFVEIPVFFGLFNIKRTIKLQ